MIGLDLSVCGQTEASDAEIDEERSKGQEEKQTFFEGKE